MADRRNDQITTIGPIELVDFPIYRLKGIPAKVDTGADGSAIWASAIREVDGELSFILFDSDSPYYSGEAIRTKDYITTLIKNSFGQREFRYKVRLTVTIAGRSIRARFTLADRSANRYPLLIGRRTLHGKYIVDVSRLPKAKVYNTAVITTVKTEPVKKFVKELKKINSRLNVNLITYSELDFYFGPNKSSITVHKTGQDLAGFDMVHLKTTGGHLDVAATIARYLRHRQVRFVDPAAANFPSTSKLYQYVIINDHKIKTPTSLFILPVRAVTAFSQFKRQLSIPFVLKDIHGSQGNYNYLIQNEADFKKAWRLALKDDIQLIGQSYIDNDGDYRILVLGRVIALVIHRLRTNAKTHINNVSQGGSSRREEVKVIPPKVQQQSILATKLLDRQIAGVDVVKDKQSGKWYFLEINDGPMLATGSYLDNKRQAMADFMERLLDH